MWRHERCLETLAGIPGRVFFSILLARVVHGSPLRSDMDDFGVEQVRFGSVRCMFDGP